MELIQKFLVIKNLAGMIVSVVQILDETDTTVCVEIHKDYLYPDCLTNIRRFTKYTIQRMMEDYMDESLAYVDVPIDLDSLGAIGDVTIELVEKTLEFK